MKIFPSNTALGLAVVGESLVVVDASLRGEQARWTATKFDRFFAEDADIPTIARSGGDGATLVWPIDRMLRRDVAIGEQSLGELKEAVAEAPDAFFPVSRDEGLLWDAHEYRDAEGVRRAMVCAIRLPEIEPVLGRLAQAGATPTRIVPSAAAWSVLRHAHDEAPTAVLDLGERGWAASEYEGLQWTGMRTGFGPAPAEVRERARREGWGVCDWRTPPSGVGESGVWRPDELTAEHAALGGALLTLVPRGEGEHDRAPTIDLLGAPAKRTLTMGPLAWYTAACAAAVIGLLVWNDAANARAQRTAAVLAAERARLAPTVERVESLRAQSEAVLAAHERLAGLEGSYRSMWMTLAELAAVVPTDAYLPSIDFADSGVSATAVAPSRTELLSAIQRSPMFEGVGPTTSSTRLPAGGEQFGLAFGFERPVAASRPAEGSAP